MKKTLKALREDANLTQREVAERLGIAQSTIGNWDQGRTLPELSVIDYPKLLALYKCSPSELREAAISSQEEFKARS